jgi:hypothetical protein
MLFVNAFLSLIVGCLMLYLFIINAKKNEVKVLIFYIFIVFIPVHLGSIGYWIILYFYYAALINESFFDVLEMFKACGNILDNIKNKIWNEQIQHMQYAKYRERVILQNLLISFSIG